MSKGMYECAVCHREFALIAEDHYIAKDPVVNGGVGVVVSGSTVYPYDAIDCPHCGCQNVLQRRKPFACPCDYGICDECCAEDEEEEETEPTVEEMVKFLGHFCNGRGCDDDECPLHTEQFECGRGKWFDIGMTNGEIKAAYKIARSEKS